MKKSTLKFIWKHKTTNGQGKTQHKTNAGGGITILDLKLYYRAIAIKTAWYLHKNGYEKQWNRIEDPDMNPHSHAHLNFDKDDKITQWKKTASSTNVAGKTGYLPAEN
jgi:hypothetical protein